MILPVSVQNHSDLILYIARHYLTHLFCVFLVCTSILQACTTNEQLPSNYEDRVDTVAQVLSQFNSHKADSLDLYFDYLFMAGKFSGVGLFAFEGSTHTISKGYRNKRAGDTLQVSDQFQLASVSKPFTAYAVLQLVDAGLIKLSDPVSEYLTGFPYTGVTVENLLTHTSGIGNYAYVTDSLWGYPEDFMTNEDFETMILCKQVPEYFRPSTLFDYCNTNYALLANVVESVTNKNFSNYMREDVFERMGMFDSEIMDVFVKNPAEYDVLGHYPNGTAKRPFYLDGVVGDKGMYSTVLDMYKFYMELQKGQMLSDSLWEEATSAKVRYASDSYYGYGWRIQPLNDGDTLVYHNGWWRGFRTYFWMSKKYDKCAIILTNSLRGGYLKRQEIWSLF